MLGVANGNAATASANLDILGSTNNDWYITGVQMEIGSQATNFEHRSFGEELALCQRYYYQPTSRFYPGVDNAPGPGRKLCYFPSYHEICSLCYSGKYNLRNSSHNMDGNKRTQL